MRQIRRECYLFRRQQFESIPLRYLQSRVLLVLEGVILNNTFEQAMKIPFYILRYTYLLPFPHSLYKLLIFEKCYLVGSYAAGCGYCLSTFRYR
jgi:hypothetical protein